MLKYAASRKSMHFDDVLQFAKLALAGIGELPPTLFVYSTENKVVVPLGELPDSTQKRILSLTNIGAGFRRDKNIGKLSEVYLATVSSVGRIGQHQTLSLSNLPPVGEEAREVLAIISLDVKTGKQASRVY